MTTKWILSTALVCLLAACESPPGGGGYGAMGGETADQADAPAPRAVESLTLEAGTPLRVRTTNALSTATVKSGEPFAATLEEPIVVGTQVIAAKGATVKGVVASADGGAKSKERRVWRSV